MDKATSVIGALDAGKLPSTQQLSQFIDWLNITAIPSIEPTDSSNQLTAQGQLLATRIRDVLYAYKNLGEHKNDDNILQEAICHLYHGDMSTENVNVDQAKQDLTALRESLSTLISVVWSSLVSESSSLLDDFASFTRLSLADAAELIEASAASAKENLREIEEGVQKGERTTITGREKERVEAEQADVKVKWEHGMDAVKGAGDTVIDATRNVSASVQDKTGRTSSRLQDAYLKICDRAQSDRAYCDAIDGFISIIQKRTHQTLDASTSDSLASFVNDPTPEQHVTQALSHLQTLFERFSSTSLSPLFTKMRVCLDDIATDPTLRQWFDDFFALAHKNLTQKGFVRSDESKTQRKDLRKRWKALMEAEDGKWKAAVEDVKSELVKIQDGLSNDEDLRNLKEAHTRLGHDIERGLVEAGNEAQTGMEALMERATWFWQDIFKVYIPRFVNFIGELPIPRTEYKDSEIEFVLENLDISTLNFLPSHVFIRNITDIDVTSTSSAPSQTAVGALTRIKLDAVQLALKDVSFWYKELDASTLAPAEHSGLLTLTLPPQGIFLDIKVRLIPASIPPSDPHSRAAQQHYNVIEDVTVSISEDVKMEIRDSNHAVLYSVFKPIFLMRLREALARTLAGQIRAMLEWMDGIAWDVARRREVFADTGVLGGGSSMLAAIWSEIGRLRKERKGGLAVRATGTGIVVEGQGETDVQFAMGAEPQILSGEKRGPLGTASEPLGKRVGEIMEETTGVDVKDVAGVKAQAQQTAKEVKAKAQGLINEGQRKVESFQRHVEAKKVQEAKREGWRSDAFNIS